mgnify:CR=1 FL=1
MNHLVRDNKVMTRKIFHGFKKWLDGTEVSITIGGAPYFWSNFCKINALTKLHFNIGFKHIPEDSYVIIDDVKKDCVLIGIDFNKLLYRGNFIAIADRNGFKIQDSTYSMATDYLDKVSFRLRQFKNVDYMDFVAELRDVFGYIVPFSGDDMLVNLLGILNHNTILKAERQELLDKIAGYFSKQLDDAIDNFLSRMHLYKGELPDRDNIVLLANINYKKGTVNVFKTGYVSTGWNILKGSKKGSVDIDVVDSVLRSGNGSPRALHIAAHIDGVGSLKDSTLYIIG